MNFTLIDYTAFGLWVPISFFISYLVIKKFKFFNGDIKIQRVLTIGLIFGHLLYLVWKYIFLILVTGTI